MYTPHIGVRVSAAIARHTGLSDIDFDNVNIGPETVALSLGELQQLVMLAVARLGPEAYGAAIQDELAEVASRQVSVPTVYVTLVRLEERGLVRSKDERPPDGRGGRARRVFELTRAGWDALGEARVASDRMWQGVVRP